MIIKVCGMREAQNIRQVEALGIDWMGMIFYPPSSRFVSEVPDYMPTRAKRVGVFVDADITFIETRINDYNLDIVQLHGHESAEFCLSLREVFPAIKTIKVFSIQSADSLHNTEVYEGVVDYFLFDTFCKEKGGSGRTFDHSILQNYKGQTPFLLSGGLSLENVETTKRFRHPQLIGYDVNSCFETAPAVKDPDRLRLFINAINES